MGARGSGAPPDAPPRCPASPHGLPCVSPALLLSCSPARLLSCSSALLPSPHRDPNPNLPSHHALPCVPHREGRVYPTLTLISADFPGTKVADLMPDTLQNISGMQGLIAEIHQRLPSGNHLRATTNGGFFHRLGTFVHEPSNRNLRSTIGSLEGHSLVGCLRPNPTPILTLTLSLTLTPLPAAPRLTACDVAPPLLLPLAPRLLPLAVRLPPLAVRLSPFAPHPSAPPRMYSRVVAHGPRNG